MIRLLEKGQEKLLFPFCAGDPFGCRVVTAARAYGTAGKEAEFWFQSVQGNICAVICRVNGECTLYNKPAADWEELDCFLNAIGYRSLFFSSERQKAGRSGPVMKWAGKRMSHTLGDCQPAPRDILRLLAACGMGNEENAAEYVDLSYKLRHGILRAVGFADGTGTLQSCAMTVAESDDTAVIGGVATDAGMRGRGFAGMLVTTLAERLEEEGKSPYLFCENRFVPFYEKHGFYVAGYWQQSGIAVTRGRG